MELNCESSGAKMRLCKFSVFYMYIATRVLTRFVRVEIDLGEIRTSS